MHADFVGPGEIFGELGLFDDTPRETAAIALEDSLICNSAELRNMNIQFFK
ncbi:MAG: hypothetical protein DRI52_12710 [Chloroflexi bacterium]|nr:MAG: hypothetical protein DRI52_12710 [Chloroflexota bacterium]